MGGFQTILPYRREKTSDFMPEPGELLKLANRYPFWEPIFDSTTMGLIGAQQTAKGSFMLSPGHYLVGVIGSSSQAAGFVIQFYDAGRNLLFPNQPINFSNAMGSSREPFYFKKLHNCLEQTLIQCSIRNLALAANNVQVVFLVYKDHKRRDESK